MSDKHKGFQGEPTRHSLNSYRIQNQKSFAATPALRVDGIVRVRDRYRPLDPDFTGRVESVKDVAGRGKCVIVKLDGGNAISTFCDDTHVITPLHKSSPPQDWHNINHRGAIVGWAWGKKLSNGQYAIVFLSNVERGKTMFRAVNVYDPRLKKQSDPKTFSFDNEEGALHYARFEMNNISTNRFKSEFKPKSSKR